MKTPTLILASQSPRRADLLRQMGFAEFQVRSPAVEELHDARFTPPELTMENALRKARVIAEKESEAVVLAADTLVYLEGEPLGKPADWAEAVAMLKRLSGRCHEVCTGVALACGDRLETFAVISRVCFKELTEQTIHAYHEVCHPLDKAGGYGIQDGTDLILQRLEGSWTNVVGLPTEELASHLNRWLAEAART
jgi:septum formation protein